MSMRGLALMARWLSVMYFSIAKPLSLRCDDPTSQFLQGDLH